MAVGCNKEHDVSTPSSWDDFRIGEDDLKRQMGTESNPSKNEAKSSCCQRDEPTRELEQESSGSRYVSTTPEAGALDTMAVVLPLSRQFLIADRGVHRTPRRRNCLILQKGMYSGNILHRLCKEYNTHCILKEALNLANYTLQTCKSRLIIP